jgi:hypothetical protein
MHMQSSSPANSNITARTTRANSPTGGLEMKATSQIAAS